MNCLTSGEKCLKFCCGYDSSESQKSIMQIDNATGRRYGPVTRRALRCVAVRAEFWSFAGTDAFIARSK
jgi:hypothetical protein